MARTTAEQARAEIVGTARRLFAEFGYESTSLQDIATGVGASKAGVLYHFGSKAQILRELMEPAAAALTELVDELDRLGPEAARRRAIDGFVDLILEYRYELTAYPAAIQQIVEQPELADLCFEELGERLVAALTAGSEQPADLLAAHVACIGVLSTAVTLAGLDPTRGSSPTGSGAEDRASLGGPSATRLIGLPVGELREALVEVTERTLGVPRG